MAETARSAAYRRGVVGRTFGHLLDSERVFGYALVAPAVIYIVALVAYPFGIALWFTVTNATVGDPLGKFTGLANLQAEVVVIAVELGVTHRIRLSASRAHQSRPEGWYTRTLPDLAKVDPMGLDLPRTRWRDRRPTGETIAAPIRGCRTP